MGKRMPEQRWNDLIVSISAVPEEKGIILVASTLSGKELASVPIRRAAETTWLQARQMMAKGLRPYLARSKLKFVSSSGEYFTLEDDEQSMSVLLHLDEDDASATLSGAVEKGDQPSDDCRCVRQRVE